MSSLGGQWRVIRHYLSIGNLHAEIEKLAQKYKPVTAEHWEGLIKKFEKIATDRMGKARALELKQKISEKQPVIVRTTTELTEEKALQGKDSEVSDIESHENISQKDLSVGAEAKEITIEGILMGLKLKKDLHFGKISEPSWKAHKPIITKSSIHSRTAYVISAIVTAETLDCLLKRSQDFIDHLQQYPEARDYAIKEGGVRALLRVRKRLNQQSNVAMQVDGVVNEALALMGYTGPTKGPGPNILSIDGGGIRGLIAIEILRHLEKITGKKVNEMFDYIIGVSTGAIIASVIGSGVGTLETASEMYKILSKKMFGNTSVLSGTSRLVWSHSYYDTEAWEQMLQEHLRDCSLTECNRYNTPKMALVSCVVNTGSRLTPFVFRSYETPFRVRSKFPGTSNARVWQAVRASAAAPTYFNEFRLNGLLHQDGGIMVNNPTGVGLHEAKLLFGASALKNGCVISVGTGRSLNKHFDYEVMSRTMQKEAPGTSWKDKFNKILDSATDTEGTHLVLNDLLSPGSYYRFNPPLMEECAMDEINPDKLGRLVTDTNSYIRRNQHKFEQATLVLSRKRSLTQKMVDYFEYQCQIMGIVQSN